MGTDRLDLWLFHRDDPSVPISELVDAVQHQVASGTIDAWGVSNWSTVRLRQALGAADASPPIATSPQFSLVDQLAEPWPGATTLTGSERAFERASLVETGITVIAWSPLAGGYLTASHQPGSKADAETSRCYDSSDNRRRRDRSQELAASRGCSPEQVAIAYVMASPLRAHAVCAARSGAEATANIEAAAMDLTSEEQRWLEQGD
jgi:aryl-alcohol dehydrogenase-like predicted oxidoreductase